MWSGGPGVAGVAYERVPSRVVCSGGRSESRGAAPGSRRLLGVARISDAEGQRRNALSLRRRGLEGGEVSVTPAGVCPVAGEGTESALSPLGWGCCPSRGPRPAGERGRGTPRGLTKADEQSCP